MADGTVVEVVGSKTGRFYAKADGKYQPGLIYRLRAELENNVGQIQRSVVYEVPRELLTPFTDAAAELPDHAEEIMREALSFAHEFGAGAPAEDIPALQRAALRYVRRNYYYGGQG